VCSTHTSVTIQEVVMKQYEVQLFYIREPPIVDIVYARDRANALLIACMNAEVNGWPKFANNHVIKEI